MEQAHPSTYSLIMRDPENMRIGVITQSKYLAIGSLVHLYNKKFGVVVTQGWPDLKLANNLILSHIKNKNTDLNISEYLQNDDLKDFRQIGALDLSGNAYVYTGKNLKSYKASYAEQNFAAVGNFLKDKEVIEKMVSAAKKEATGSIIDALYYGILAGLRNGGEVRGQQSASIKIWNYSDVDSVTPEVDLRVDNSVKAIEDLGELIKDYKLYFGKTKNVVNTSVVQLDIRNIINSFIYENSETDDVSLNDIFRFENLEGRWQSPEEVDVEALSFLKEKYLKNFKH